MKGLAHREETFEFLFRLIRYILYKNLVGGTELSHKFFVTLSSVAVSRQKGRSRVNKCFIGLIWTSGSQDKPMIALVLLSAPKKDFAIAKC